MNGTQVLSPPTPKLATATRAAPDLRDVKGQESAKRALEIAAAGGHNLLMIGPPGAGKSMLAQRLPGLAAAAGRARGAGNLHGAIRWPANWRDGAISRERPFRNPHHSASMAALAGGGLRVKPGEVSLAHLGVLFLDELPEFQRGVLDSLRQPIETGEAVVARANAHVRYPARFQLVAAMNPCRCGYLAIRRRPAAARPNAPPITRRASRGRCSTASTCMSKCAGVAASDLALPPPREGSAEVAARVAARATSSARGSRARPCAPTRKPKANCWTASPRRSRRDQASDRSGGADAAFGARLSAACCGWRAPSPIWRARRTVLRPHIAEALSYRRLALQN